MTCHSIELSSRNANASVHLEIRNSIKSLCEKEMCFIVLSVHLLCTFYKGIFFKLYLQINIDEIKGHLIRFHYHGYVSFKNTL